MCGNIEVKHFTFIFPHINTSRDMEVSFGHYIVTFPKENVFPLDLVIKASPTQIFTFEGHLFVVQNVKEKHLLHIFNYKYLERH